MKKFKEHFNKKIQPVMGLVFLFVTIFTLLSTISYGKYSVTKFSNPSFCSAYPSSYYSVSFSLNERSKNGHSGFPGGQTNTTLVIGFSNSSFEFNPGVGTVTVTGTDVTIVNYTITASSITVTITTASHNSELNTIQFNNLQVRATAAATGYLKRTGGTFKVDNKANIPGSTYSWGDLTAQTPLAYSSSSATQGVTSTVFAGVTDNQILGVQIVITGTCSSLNVTDFTFSTTGSTAPATDIAKAKVYYTATTNSFSTSNLFGSKDKPSGSFTISGSQALNLSAGTYYFWLTYDLETLATSGNLVDAQFTSVIVGGSTQAASSGNPAGNRSISTNVYYSIANGNWTSTALWSRNQGGASCSCAPTSGNGVVFIYNTIVLNSSSTVDLVIVGTGGNLSNASSQILTVSSDLKTTGSGLFSASSSWVLKNIHQQGSGLSTVSSALSLSGVLNIDAGTTFQVSGGGTLTVNGDITVNGTLDLGTSPMTSSNAAGIYLSGVGTISGSNTITLGTNKTVVSGSSLTISPSVSISNNIVVTNNGIVKMMSNISGGGSNAKWINSSNATLEMNGTTSALLSTGILDATATGNTVSYTGTGNQNVKTPSTATYYNLYVGNSSGTSTKALQAAVIVAGDLQISGGAQLDVSGTTANTITLSGNWINNSTNSTPFNGRTSTVFFAGNNSISGSAITAFNAVEITTTGSLTSNATSGKVVVAANWANEGDFEHNNGDITFNGTSTVSGASTTEFYTIIVNASKSITLHATETDFAGDLTVNGTLSHNSGLVIATGAGNSQNVNGAASELILYDFEADNESGTVILSRPLTINHSLALTNGLIQSTSTNILTVIDNATAGSGSSTSFVSGPVKKLGNDAFVFPIGKSAKWMRLGITAPSSTSTSFTAEYFNSGYSNISALTSPLTDVSNQEYWTLDRAVTTDQVKISLYWENATVNKINDCSDLTVAHWNGSSWIQEAATAAGSCSGSGTGTVTTNAVVTSYSPFTFGSKSLSVNPLPIKLINFTGAFNGNRIDLVWKTATERNNDYFTVQKSRDGFTFEDIITVKGAGNSAVTQKYTTADYKPYSGISYYRLKQTDYDNKFEYAGIIAVNVDHDDYYEVSVFPNPAIDIINISWPYSGEAVRIRLVDSQNREVHTTSETGSNAVMDVSDRPSGIYFLSIQTAGDHKMKRIVISR